MRTTFEKPEMFVAKDHYGKWNAKSSFALPDNRVLNLRTYKNDRGLLLTTACVSLREDGFETYVAYQDYYAVLHREERMATSRSVAAQHQLALDAIQDTLKWVTAHYAKETTPA